MTTHINKANGINRPAKNLCDSHPTNYPITFYLQGICFWVLMGVIILWVIRIYVEYPKWIGFVILIPYCVFWGLKGFKKYRKDKL